MCLADGFPILLLTSSDRFIQGPGGLPLDSCPGLGPGERTLCRETEVGVPRFYLLAMTCVVLGKTLACVCTSVSSCKPISSSCSTGVMGQT